MARAMPASPQLISSLTRHIRSPVGSEKAWRDEVEGVEAVLGRLLDDGPRRLLPLVPFAAGRPDDVLGELVDPLLDLELVLVQVEREVGHGAPSLGDPAAAGTWFGGPDPERPAVHAQPIPRSWLPHSNLRSHGPPRWRCRLTRVSRSAADGGARRRCPRPSNPGPPARRAARRPGRSPSRAGPRRARPPGGPLPRRPRRSPPAAAARARAASTAAVRARRRPRASSPASAAVCAAVTRSKMPASAPGRVEVVVHARPERRQRRGVDVDRRRRALDHVARPLCGEQVADAEAPGQRVQPLQRLLGVGHRVGRHLDGRAVVRPQHQEPVGPGVVRAPAGRCSEVKLPSDLDILVPSTSTQPLCTQWRANAVPSATAWARSFSWCGKARSCPPPWRSKPSPSRSSDMTTHSVCQPGRPGTPRRRPSSARPAWPSSTGRSRAASASPRSPRPGPRPAANRASGGPAARSRRPGRRRDRRRRTSRRPRPGRAGRATSSTMSSMYAVAWGMSSGRRTPSAVHGLPPARLELGRHARARCGPRSFARLMMLSSTSVTFET